MSKKQRARHSTSILTSAKEKAQATSKDPERPKKRKGLVYLDWVHDLYSDILLVEDACLRAKYLGLQEFVWKASCSSNSQHQTTWRFENESEGAKIGGGAKKRNCDAKRAPTIGPHAPGFHRRRAAAA